jgi:hypothetical protein
MKKLLLIALLFFGIKANAQIEKIDNQAENKQVIGVNRTIGMITAELSKVEDIYYLMYRDNKFTHIVDYKTIQFKANDDELNSLYLLLKDSFNSVEQVKLAVGNSDLLINKKKMMGVNYLSIGVDTKGVFGLFIINEKQLAKLFNKEF